MLFSKSQEQAANGGIWMKNIFTSIDTGFDGGKKINGRKRHIAVDALGIHLAMHISVANI